MSRDSDITSASVRPFSSSIFVESERPSPTLRTRTRIVTAETGTKSAGPGRGNEDPKGPDRVNEVREGMKNP